MRKRISLISLLFVVVSTFLVSVVPTQAQGILRGGYIPSSPEGWYYYFRGDQVHMLQADQINWVAETMNIGRRVQMRRVTDDLVEHGPYTGLQGPRGFYPMYQCEKGQRIGRYAANTGIGILIGAIAGGKKGAAIGGSLGAAVAVREDLKCWSVQNRMVVIDDPSDLAGGNAMPQSSQTRPPQIPSSRENGWNQRLRNQALAGNSWFGSQPSCLEQGMATLKNDGHEVIRIYQNGNPYVALTPRQSECGDPFASYEAEVISMAVDGYAGTAGVARTKPEGRSGLVLVWR